MKYWLIYGGHFDIPKIKQEILELSQKTEDPSFWNDRQTAESIIKQLNEKKELVNSIESKQEEISSSLELLDLLEIETDPEMEVQLEDSVTKLNGEIEQLNLLLL